MSSSRSMTLAALEAEIRNLEGMGTCVLFNCPTCGRHTHAIPYEPGVAEPGKTPRGGHRWGNPSGSTVADITLTPSYLARAGLGSGQLCRFHCFVRGGVVEILGDSEVVPEGS